VSVCNNYFCTKTPLGNYGCLRLVEESRIYYYSILWKLITVCDLEVILRFWKRTFRRGIFWQWYIE